MGALPVCLHIVQVLHNAAIQVYQTPQNDHSTSIRGSEEWVDLYEKFPSVGFVGLQTFIVVSQLLLTRVCCTNVSG